MNNNKYQIIIKSFFNQKKFKYIKYNYIIQFFICNSSYLSLLLTLSFLIEVLDNSLLASSGFLLGNAPFFVMTIRTVTVATTAKQERTIPTMAPPERPFELFL